MPGDVAAGGEHCQTGRTPYRRLPAGSAALDVPVVARGGEARMTAPRQFIVLALDDELRLPKAS